MRDRVREGETVRKEREREQRSREDNIVLHCSSRANKCYYFVKPGALFAVTLLSKGPFPLKIIMYDPVEEEGHLVRHIMASLSAYKSAIVSQCHLSSLSLRRIIMHELRGTRRRVFMCFMGYLSL